MDFIKLSLFLVISCIDLVLGEEVCYNPNDGILYCDYGCCGDTYDEYCCGVYFWIIVVAVVGAIIFISVIVVIVCIVYKKKTHTGRVTNPASQTQHVHTTQIGHVPPPGYNQQPQFQSQFQSQFQTQSPQYPPPAGDAVYPPPPSQYF